MLTVSSDLYRKATYSPFRLQLILPPRASGVQHKALIESNPTNGRDEKTQSPGSQLKERKDCRGISPPWAPRSSQNRPVQMIGWFCERRGAHRRTPLVLSSLNWITTRRKPMVSTFFTALNRQLSTKWRLNLARVCCNISRLSAPKPSS